MSDSDSSPELLTFYTLLEQAWPERSVEVQAAQSHENYVNEIRSMQFNGQDWRLVDFPDDENDAVVEAFELLSDESKLYYIAAYMRESIIDYYYQAGCLRHLKVFARPDGLLARMDAYQREAVVWYCDLGEAQINEMPMMDRLMVSADLMALKNIRNTIKNTVW